MEDEFIIFQMPQTMLNIIIIYRDIVKLLYTQDYNWTWFLQVLFLIDKDKYYATGNLTQKIDNQNNY